MLSRRNLSRRNWSRRNSSRWTRHKPWVYGMLECRLAILWTFVALYWRWHIWVILMYAEGCGVHSTYWVPCWCVVIPFSDLWRGSCACKSFTWNYFSHEEPCTNNHLEGWHNRLKRVSRKAHSNLFEVVEILKKEQATTEVAIEQLAGGGRIRSKWRKVVQHEDTIKRL